MLCHSPVPSVGSDALYATPQAPRGTEFLSTGADSPAWSLRSHTKHGRDLAAADVPSPRQSTCKLARREACDVAAECRAAHLYPGALRRSARSATVAKRRFAPPAHDPSFEMDIALDLVGTLEFDCDETMPEEAVLPEMNINLLAEVHGEELEDLREAYASPRFWHTEAEDDVVPTTAPAERRPLSPHLVPKWEAVSAWERLGHDARGCSQCRAVHDLGCDSVVLCARCVIVVSAVRSSVPITLRLVFK